LQNLLNPFGGHSIADSFGVIGLFVVGAAASGVVLLSGKLGIAIVAPVLTLGIWYAGRQQSRRQQTLELFREYYSPDFAKYRVDAERFFSLFPKHDWSADDIYNLPDSDGYREGYSTVTRFFHRTAILFEEGQLDRSLARKLLARETGYWFAVVYELMAERKGMFTREAIFRLGRELINLRWWS